MEVKRQLFASAARLAWPSGVPGEVGMEEYLNPVVGELNRGLENFGLKIKEAACTFAAGPALVRLVAAEQETVEKAAPHGPQ